MPSTPLWRNIAENIRASIRSGEFATGQKLPSESELAAQYQVCRMTAHRAMHELQRQGLVTRRPRRGTVVADQGRRRTGVVAMLSFATDDFPSVSYLRGLRSALSDEYHLVFCDTGENAASEATALQRMSSEADAIACVPTCAPENTPLLQRIIASGTPFVCLDRVPSELETDAIVSTNYESSLQILRTLIARGHTRIAHFTDRRLQVSSTRERYEAYVQATSEVGELQPEHLTRFFTTYTIDRAHYYEQLVQEVHDALFTMLHHPSPPTALFCLQDYYLAAVLDACERLKVSIPEQLEIVSFNDCPSQFLRVSRGVHRIVQQPYEMGLQAAQRLQDRLHNNALPAEIVRVPTRLFSADLPYLSPIASLTHPPCNPDL